MWMDRLFVSALTCDVGALEAVTWQPVGGAVYMQNLAINSVKCLPEPQIRRQDCHHRLKVSNQNEETQNWHIAESQDILSHKYISGMGMSKLSIVRPPGRVNLFRCIAHSEAKS